MAANFVIVEQHGGKLFASCTTVEDGNNLLPIFKWFSEAIVIEYQPSCKAARELAEQWNKDYGRNGTAMTVDEYKEMKEATTA